MRWKHKPQDAWHRGFALFPVEIQGHTVWLERFWYRQELSGPFWHIAYYLDKPDEA